MLIGLSGFKQSGKDTVANYLVEKYGFGKHGFADKLRELAMHVPMVVGDGQTFKESFERIGYEATKETYKSARNLLQFLGVGARETFGEDFWVDQLYKQLESTYGTYTRDLGVETFQGNVVISDCRFPNEAEFIRRMGGLVIVVDRGLESTDTHVSEIPLPPTLTDGTIQNLGSVEVLHQTIDEMLDFIGFKK